MKKLALLFYFSFFIFHCSFAQGTWTWLKGDSTGNGTGTFGVQGITDSLNNPPGSYEPVDWVDLQGDFWIFGPVATGGYADLWKYDPLTNNWTWVKGNGQLTNPGNYGTKGIPSLSNQPPFRLNGAASWVGLNGDLWLYGGYGSGGGLSDLWKYNIATNTWTWMHGSNGVGITPVYGTKGVANAANTPGARWECAATWVDAVGNLWLFGGYSSHFNDLWKYDIATNEWTWVSGTNLTSQPGVYGTKGVPSPANIPGGRYVYSSWKDSNGDFWMFGGGYSGKSYNDMWKYSPATNEWTWMSGTNTGGDAGNYGTLCTASTNYVPAARMENRARWTDDCGKFWQYGGNNLGGGKSYMSDLWCFDPTTLEWTLVNMGTTLYSKPVFGKKGISSPTNQPGARYGNIAWKGKNGDPYIYGGFGYGGQRMNDIWKYQPSPTCPVGGVPPSFSLGKDTAVCGSVNKTLQTGYANTQWSTGASGPQITVTIAGKYWATVKNGCGIATDTIIISQSPGAIAGNISSNKDSICEGTALTSTFTATGTAGNIQWQESTDSINFTNIPGATNSTFTTPPFLPQTTYYRAIATTGGGCLPDTTAISVLHIIPSPSASFVDSVTGKVVKFTSTTGGNVIYYTWDFGDSTSSTLANPTHTYTRADTFNVCLTVYNASNCSFTFCKDVITTLGTDIETRANSPLRVYPNPTHDKLIVENFSSAISQLSITNMLGERLMIKDVSPGTYRDVLDLSMYPPGIYFLHIACGEQSGTYKVVHY